MPTLLTSSKDSNIVIEENVADKGDTTIIFSLSERFLSRSLSPVSLRTS